MSSPVKKTFHPVWAESVALKKKRDFKAALELAEHVWAQEPENPYFVCGTADLYKKTRQLDKAQALYLTIADRNEIAANGLAQSYLVQGRYNEAERWYQKNAERNEIAACGLAQTYLVQGRYDEAERWYQKNAERNEIAANGLAQTYLVQGRYDKAERWYQKNADRNEIAACGLAQTYLVQGRYNEAERWYQKYADRDEIAANGLAQTYLTQGKDKMAEPVIARLEISSRNPMTFYLGAMVAFKAGDLQKAKQRLFTMADRCRFDKKQQPMLRLMTEAGILDETLYAVILAQEHIQPETVQRKPIEQVLKEFNTTVEYVTERTIQAPVSAVYQQNFIKPVNRQARRVTDWPKDKNIL